MNEPEHEEGRNKRVTGLLRKSMVITHTLQSLGGKNQYGVKGQRERGWMWWGVKRAFGIIHIWLGTTKRKVACEEGYAGVIQFTFLLKADFIHVFFFCLLSKITRSRKGWRGDV